MPTLAEQIATAVTATTDATTLVDLTRGRSAGTTVDTTRLAAVCEIVADQIKSHLGEIDGTDGQAVAVGTDMVLENLGGKKSRVGGAENRADADSYEKRLMRIAKSRLEYEMFEPGLNQRETPTLDKLYPRRDEETS